MNSVTLTPQFMKWFGNSIVRDAEGKPLLMNHGSGNETFSIFDPSRGIGGGNWFTPLFESAQNSAISWNGRVMKVYLKIERPLFARVSDRGDKGPEYWAKRAKRLGYDGLILSSDDYLPNEKGYVIFDPYQVKSADQNCGDFDPTNPDIYL